MKKQIMNKPPFKLRVLSWLPGLIAMVAIIAVMIPVLLWFVPRGSMLCIVEGASMDQTLHDGQLMFQDGKDFARGDIITCYEPSKNANKAPKILVKRIVGMPGEMVRIDESGVYINDEKLGESYLTPEAVSGTYRGDMQIQLGSSEYYVLGDNRTVSHDSRSFGPVDHSLMLYKVSAKPAMPFLLAMGKVLVIVVAALFLNTWLEELLVKLFCKMNPELEKVIEEQSQKNQKKKKKARETTE